MSSNRGNYSRQYLNFKGIRRKYNNEKIVVDGEEFDSVGESQRWAYLKILEKRGEIRNLRRQVYYELTPVRYYIKRVFNRKGKELTPRRYVLERASGYYADFVYEARNKESMFITDPAWREVVEDFKGKETSEFALKRKMMLHIHGKIIYITKKPSEDIPKEIRLVDDLEEQVNGYYSV